MKPSTDLTFKGKVAKDPDYAARLVRLFRNELQLISAHSYRSILIAQTFPELSEIFDGIAQEESGHFRTLRELISALGGEPLILTGVREDETAEEEKDPPPFRLISRSRSEVLNSIDLCETLMGKTADRIVRSVIEEILRDKYNHLKKLREIS